MGYCGWASIDELDRIYHDTEWGIPVHDDRHMFEHLTLECLQCGLSWALMLKKREIFRECFDNFDCDKIAAYDEKDAERILNTEGMIRSPRKVNAVIGNARCYQKVREESVIPVEKINGKLVLLAAKNDTCWDAEGAARRMYARRKAAGLETEAIVYRHGVHVLLPDCVPLIGIMIRMMFKEAKKYPKEVKATRRKVAEKIETVVKNW